MADQIPHNAELWSFGVTVKIVLAPRRTS